MRHLFANFKKNHQGKELKDLMWGVAKASTRAAFESYMKQMEIVSKEACDDLRGKSPMQWARHAFPYYPKCDMLLNNLCETFNSLWKQEKSHWSICLKPLEDISWLGSVKIGIQWLGMKALFVTRSSKNWRNVKRLALIAHLFGHVGQSGR